ncbi:hypothetical protein PA25_03610 [Pseudoalteromonas sp. A25]|uniref:PilW family protein n=1 Tax=Pseudoalteromonas sp. A25 TaxID=116092 RepID=UPI0012A042DB|nr:prepilin-type N-terminal cleavage/methylation domain-containing protein [Pseudoalteromonas sp. A25]BBN80376.1 hypothetical protein PA25_03610 [Pseudoalteromonas sp. A25]
MNRKGAGFTLIEIMVASVILFMVLGTVSIVYRGALLSSSKASEHLLINAQVAPLLSLAESHIRSESKTEKEQLKLEGSSNDVRYSITASLIDFRSPPQRFDVDSGSYQTPPKKYKLWNVELMLTHNGITKNFVFKQLGWLDE